METFEGYELLSGVNSPDDLKAIPAAELPRLATEIRHYLSSRVRKNGGHLASNLGVVELTMAIHRVFDSPRDHIVFDVGHQSYVHKLLTGRKEQFDTLRLAGGISGFTRRDESEHDAFGAGHSSTAVSAAIGYAEADALAGSDAYTVAVVGDGALTGGLSYEGLNNCRPDLKLIIIINENEMSISPNTGRLAGHLSQLRASRGYLKTKRATAATLRGIPLIGKPLYRFVGWCKRRIKHLFYRENLFEHMGIRYMGPIDGNDLDGVIASLEHAKTAQGSVILHVKTKKGLGDEAAEESPAVYHGIAPQGYFYFGPSSSESFGEALCREAAENENICAITAAMSAGTGLDGFAAAYPRRFFDVGIAEGHAVTFAAGLAAGGQRPVVAVYSTFLQRAYDNVLHDVALQHLPVVLAIDRAGFNAADGPTHHGVFDVSMLSSLPGVSIFTPVTAEGIAASLRAALETASLSAIRYAAGPFHEELAEAFYPTGPSSLEPPRVRIFDAAPDPAVTVVTHGRIATEALAAAKALLGEGISVRVLLAEYIAPYDRLAEEVLPYLGGATVLYEEEIRSGGFGEHLFRALRERGYTGEMAVLASDNPFARQEPMQSILTAAGVDREALSRVVTALYQNTRRQ